MLKDIPDTKVVVLGIGSGVGQDELDYMASEPKDDNVILVEDFSKLEEVKQLLIDTTCNGR